MGVTAQDLAVALLDYHDDADLSVDPVMAVPRPGTDWLHPMQHPSEPTAIRRIGSDQARV
jgi:hypothetical protein